MDNHIAHLISNLNTKQLCFQSAMKFSSIHHMRNVQLIMTRLSSRGGVFVDIPSTELGMMEMLDAGDFFDGDCAHVISDNATDEELTSVVSDINDSPSDYHLFEGYALFHDGIWRSHDWIYNSEEGTILDEIPAKTLYYGIAIATGTPEAAQVAARLIFEDEED